MIKDLAGLIAPAFTLEQFRAALLAGEILRKSDVLTPDHFALMNWDVLRGVLQDGDVHLKDIRVRRGIQELSSVFYTTAGSIDVSKIEAILAAGGSIILSHVERYAKAWDVVYRAAEAATGEKLTIALFVTQGPGGAINQHYDEEDILVLQLEGAKRWLITGERVRNPVKDMVKPPKPNGPPHYDQMLERGDMLFLPSGYWHRCENCSERSVHLGLAFEPPTPWDAVKRKLRSLLEDETFRTPLNRLPGAERAEVENQVRQRLRETAATFSVARTPDN